MELMKLDASVIEKLVVKGDLSGLNQQEKIQYYSAVCRRLGLDPAMQPFKLLNLQGKQVLYLDRSGAQQLNRMYNISHAVQDRQLIEAAGVYQVTARASTPDGRFTDSIGAVNIKNLFGDAYANAIMKAETKAKRRATLDLLGLGMLDETEVSTIPGAKQVAIESVVEPEDIQMLNDMVGTSTLDENARSKALDHIATITNYAEFTKALHRLEEVQYDQVEPINPNQKDIARKVKEAVSRENT